MGTNHSNSAHFNNLGTTEKTVTLEEIAMELQTKQPPELEFSMPEVEESLTAYLSAIGGAIIGLLLTLLVLAIWNGGTLNFTNTSKVNALEAGMTAVSSDLDGINTNVDALGERILVLEQEAGAVAALQKSLATLDTSLSDLDRSLSDQGIHISELDSAVSDLQVTRRNFDLFTAALTQALAMMDSETSAATPVNDTASGATRQENTQAVEAVPTTTASQASNVQSSEEATLALSPAEPLAIESADVAPDALLVYLYLDANADGVFDNTENFIAGATFTLSTPDGRAVAVAENDGTAGTLFGDLDAGDYTVSVEDVQGYLLASQNSAGITIEPEAEAGQIIYFAVVTTAGD
jgi:hypothetical protein